MLLYYNNYAFVICLLSDHYTMISRITFEYGKIEQKYDSFSCVFFKSALLLFHRNLLLWRSDSQDYSRKEDNNSRDSHERNTLSEHDRT